MWTNKKAVFHKKTNLEKLTEYGFILQDDFYIRSADIMGDIFRLNIYVTVSGVTKLEVIDKASKSKISNFSQNRQGCFAADGVKAPLSTFWNE